MTVKTFSYTGAFEEWTVPAGVTSIVTVTKGGDGQAGSATAGLSGGRVTATYAVTPGDTIRAYVGASGANGGWGSISGGGTSPAGKGGGQSKFQINGVDAGIAGGGGGGGGAGSAATGGGTYPTSGYDTQSATYSGENASGTTGGAHSANGGSHGTSGSNGSGQTGGAGGLHFIAGGANGGNGGTGGNGGNAGGAGGGGSAGTAGVGGGGGGGGCYFVDGTPESFAGAGGLGAAGTNGTAGTTGASSAAGGTDVSTGTNGAGDGSIEFTYTAVLGFLNMVMMGVG